MGEPAVDLVAEVSVSSPQILYPVGGQTGPTVAVLDCGVKNNILRALLARGAGVVRLPWDSDPAACGAPVDGVLISNGPGDPKDAAPTVATVRRLLEREVPTFGICYGNQVLALAAGADTFKLKWGHRGQNQPCIDLDSGRCYITSQNHGYSVDEQTLPDGWEPWFRNANDQTNEGIRHRRKPFSAVQFHPEAHPGPEDMGYLIDDFLASLA
jgi:carbamoyl-phosphate synthase small subunit